MPAIAKEPPRRREDALSYLPRRNVAEYHRGQIIYDEHHPSEGLSLVIEGRVIVTLTRKDGSQIVTGVFSCHAFFGEEALLLGKHHRQATALQTTRLMSWSRAEIDAQIERHPRLGLALTQMLAERCLEFEERLQSMALDTTLDRLTLTLIRFAKSGRREDNGAVCIPPMTHDLVARYIGTSREIVAGHMNKLRRLGLLRYSRNFIELYPEALRKHLRMSKTG